MSNVFEELRQELASQEVEGSFPSGFAPKFR